MKTKPVLATTVAGLALALAPSAFAQDYCVADAACVSGGGTPQATLDAAIGAANVDVAKDRIFLGAGTFTAASTDGFLAVNPVEIHGGGPGSTTVTGPADTDTVLQLGDGSSVSDLHIHLPFSSTGFTKYGIDAPAGVQLDHLSITGEANMPAPAIGAVVGTGSAIRHSTVDIPIGTNATTAVQADDGGTVEDDVLNAGMGVHVLGHDVSVRRSRITAQSGVNVRNSATNNVLEDSLIHVLPKGIGVTADTGNGTDAGIAVRGSTIVGVGDLTSRGILVDAFQAVHVATVDVDSTVIRGVGKSIVRFANLGTANASIQYSDYDPATATNTGPGTTTEGPGNVNVDPLFAGADDQHLLAGSPVIDAGNPADLGDLTDLDGNARVIDGNADATARRDIGAYESPAVPAQPPSDGGSPSGGSSSTGAPDGGSPSGGSSAGGGDAGAPPAGSAADSTGGAVLGVPSLADRTAPVITLLRAHRGQRLTFNLSEYAVVRIDVSRRSNDARLHKLGTVRRVFAVGPAKVRLRQVGGKTLRPGSYVAKLTATDAARNRSRTYNVRFQVAR